MDTPALHVIFGTGPLGVALMHRLRARGHRVRMINRSARVAFEKDMQTEVGGGDAGDPKLTREVCEGASVVYHCIGLPYPEWHQFPRIARGIVEGAAFAQAPLIYGDNLYMYGKTGGPMREDAPIAPLAEKGRIRADVAEIMFSAQTAGKVRVAIGRASDFFGPRVTDASMLGSRVFGRLITGQSAQVVGNPDTLHSYTFIEDFANALAILGEQHNGIGRVWHVPTAPPMTTRAIVQHIASKLGTPARLSTLGRFMVGIAGMFDKNAKALKEMLYEFESDFIVDSSLFETTFNVRPTPMTESLNRTLEWFRQQAAGKR